MVFVLGNATACGNVSDSDTNDATDNTNGQTDMPDSRLPIPVRFILDDFSTNTLIPDFDKIISVIRSREIYVSLIVQSLSQLEGLYGESKAQTIVNNCDTCLYLGGTDVRTANYFAGKLNVQRSTVLNLPLDRMYLFIRGSEPRRIRKYDLDSDSAYKALVTEMERKTQEGGTYESQR